MERIYSYAFAGCQNLKRVDFTNKLGDIGSYAFYDVVCNEKGSVINE